MGAFVECFERRGSGVLVGVGSVADERGRTANYVYGSAKAGFTAFLARAAQLARPTRRSRGDGQAGLCAYPLTHGTDLPSRLTAEPEEVAAAVIKAIRRRRDPVYVRRVRIPIMFMTCTVPERVFKRLRL